MREVFVGRARETEGPRQLTSCMPLIGVRRALRAAPARSTLRADSVLTDAPQLYERRLMPFLSQTSHNFWSKRTWYFRHGLYYQGGMVSACNRRGGCRAVVGNREGGGKEGEARGPTWPDEDG